MKRNMIIISILFYKPKSMQMIHVLHKLTLSTSKMAEGQNMCTGAKKLPLILFDILFI